MTKTAKSKPDLPAAETPTPAVGSVDPLTVMTNGRTLPDGCDQWAMRSVRADFTSSRGYRYPFPGAWAEAPGPIADHTDECPRDEGDGICAATTYQGMASGVIPARAVLLVGYADADVLGGSRAGKLRLRRMFIADIIDGEKFLANLGYANLGSANLGSANLRSANLRYADLRSAKLGYADLGYADLGYADLGSANLRSANLRSANLRYADLRSANLGYAKLGYADLRSANLGYADLGYAKLGYADLGYANLGYADLGYADLGYANLRSANLRYANLSEAYNGQLALWPEGFAWKAAGVRP